MPVAESHRFLHGRKPQTEYKQLWVLSGQVQDIFYHNLLHGCVSLRRTLELWALENGIELVVFLNRFGELDFTGNANPDEARKRFEGLRRRRPPLFETVVPPLKTEPPGDNNSSTSEATSSDSDRTQRQQAANQAQQATGGQGQLNTTAKLAQLLKNKTVPSLVIVEDITTQLRDLRLNPITLPIAYQMITTIQKEWHGDITSSNLLVFLCDSPDTIKTEILPERQYLNVLYQDIHGPAKPEMLSALERLAPRQAFELAGADIIAENLSHRGNMKNAIRAVKIVVNKGERKVTLDSILSLPPINEQAIAAIKQEFQALTGLKEFKEKLDKLEATARDYRRCLAEGEPILPEHPLHLVLTGNPGTGKTTVAKMAARLFHAIGMLQHSNVHEVLASSIMSSTVGETREKMHSAIEAARGGVLFIDEAHNFGDPESTQAKEAIQALVPAAWNYRQEMIIILAGYGDKMKNFFQMDTGLDRRFPELGRSLFADYSQAELWEILERELQKQGFRLEPAMVPRLRSILQRRSSRFKFGNAGGVKNLLAEIIGNHRASLDATSKTLTPADLPPLIRQDQAVFDAAMQKLNSMQGLEKVKHELITLVNISWFDLEQAEAGLSKGEVHLHPGNMLFVGSPGTGKTSVARLMCDLLYGLGRIEARVFVEVGRSKLVAGYEGQTALRVRAVVEEARDGILFIDEAYGLVNAENDSFGKEAVTELVTQITHRENAGTVFILAGYENEINRFLQSNPGLDRRFGKVVRFDNFPPDACVKLAEEHLTSEGLTWEEGFLEVVGECAAATAAAKGTNFGNAGWVLGLIGSAQQRMKSRVVQNGIPPTDPARLRVLIADMELANE